MAQDPHILYLTTANDGNLDELKDERKVIEKVLKSSKDEKILQIKPEAQVQFNDLKDYFSEAPVKIFHYGGHSNGLHIMLKNKNLEQKVPIKDFAEFLGNQSKEGELYLVFLNSCLSENLADALLEAGVPVVIGTTESIIDEDAKVFAKNFYQSLT